MRSPFLSVSSDFGGLAPKAHPTGLPILPGELLPDFPNPPNPPNEELDFGDPKALSPAGAEDFVSPDDDNGLLNGLGDALCLSDVPKVFEDGVPNRVEEDAVEGAPKEKFPEVAKGLGEVDAGANGEGLSEDAEKGNPDVEVGVGVGAASVFGIKPLVEGWEEDDVAAPPNPENVEGGAGIENGLGVEDEELDARVVAGFVEADFSSKSFCTSRRKSV